MKLILILLATLFTQANEQYAQGQYADAAQLYSQCLTAEDAEYQSDANRAQIYYNLGNAYFKQGELAQAILAYERSLRLRPMDKDTRYNLRFAESRITDNIADNRSFFLTTFLRDVRNLLTEGTWMGLSIGAFIVLLLCALGWALLREPQWRKAAFSLGIITLFVSVIALCNGTSLHKRDTLRQEAIIVQGVVNAKASPDRSGTELFTLHEGTKVRITETIGEWCSVTVGNYQGWIQLQNVERI